MKQFLELTQYQILNEEQKKLVVERFNIKRSGNSEVVDNVVTSDGVLPNDVAVINVGRMIEYLGFVPKCANIEKFFDICWDEVLVKMFGKNDDEQGEVEKSSQPEEEGQGVLSDDEKEKVNETSNQ